MKSLLTLIIMSCILMAQVVDPLKTSMISLIHDIQDFNTTHPANAKADTPTVLFKTTFSVRLQAVIDGLSRKGFKADSADLKTRITGPVRFIVPTLERDAGLL